MSEHVSEFSQCDHVRCEFPYKGEYCELDGSEIDGPASVVAELISSIMYPEGDSERGNFRYETDGRTMTFEREFDLLIGSNVRAGWAWPLESLHVHLEHTRQPAQEYESFVVTTGWNVHQEVATGLPPYTTTYTIDLWPDTAQATITEHDLRTELLDGTKPVPMVERPMVPYDHEVLFTLIGTVMDSQKAEPALGAIADNS